MRLRIFAGPNGSGKTTLVHKLDGSFNFGVFVNADNLKSHLDQKRYLNLDELKLKLNDDSLQTFWEKHGLSEKAPLCLSIDNNVLVVKDHHPLNSYHAAILSSFFRFELLKTKSAFTCETVFSHPSKLAMIDKANSLGYRTYLYFIATNSPNINVGRVQERAAKKGHDVPPAKIVARYTRSLENLCLALNKVHRVYLFDNSEKKIKYIAELTPNKELHLKTARIPTWISESLLQKKTNEG